MSATLTLGDQTLPGIALEPARPDLGQIAGLERSLHSLADRIRAGVSHNVAELRRLLQLREQMIDAVEKSQDAWQEVTLARAPQRPHARQAAHALLRGFVELGGARGLGDDPALVAGYGLLDDRTVVFAGHERGTTAEEKLARHYGMMSPAGYRKFQRVVQWAERHGYPVVTYVDTPGALPGIESEETGVAQSIAHTLHVMAGLRVPTLAIVAGEGGSGGALAMALCDRLLMLSHAIFSVIAPEACASILWRDGARAREAAALLKITARDLLAQGIIDGIIPEPRGGAHRQPGEALASLRQHVRRELAALAAQDTPTRLDQRYRKYRSMGRYSTMAEAA